MSVRAVSGLPACLRLSGLLWFGCGVGVDFWVDPDALPTVWLVELVPLRVLYPLPSFLPPSHFSLVITCMFPHSLKHATLFPTSLLFITVSRTTSGRSIYEPNPTQHKAHLYMLLITIMSEVLWGGHYLTW